MVTKNQAHVTTTNLLRDDFFSSQEDSFPNVKPREYTYIDTKTQEQQGPFTEEEMKIAFSLGLPKSTLITPLVYITNSTFTTLPQLPLESYFPENRTAFSIPPLPPNHVDTWWLFKNHNNVIFGPYVSAQMREWFVQGRFFNANTLVHHHARGGLAIFVPLGIVFSDGNGMDVFLHQGDNRHNVEAYIQQAVDLFASAHRIVQPHPFPIPPTPLSVDHHHPTTIHSPPKETASSRASSMDSSPPPREADSVGLPPPVNPNTREATTSVDLPFSRHSVDSSHYIPLTTTREALSTEDLPPPPSRLGSMNSSVITTVPPPPPPRDGISVDPPPPRFDAFSMDTREATSVDFPPPPPSPSRLAASSYRHASSVGSIPPPPPPPAAAKTLLSSLFHHSKRRASSSAAEEEDPALVIAQFAAQRGWNNKPGHGFPTKNPFLLYSLSKNGTNPWTDHLSITDLSPDHLSIPLFDVYVSPELPCVFPANADTVVVCGAARTGQSPVLRILSSLQRGAVVREDVDLLGQVDWIESRFKPVFKKTPMLFKTNLSTRFVVDNLASTAKLVVCLREPNDLRLSVFRHVRRTFAKFHHNNSGRLVDDDEVESWANLPLAPLKLGGGKRELVDRTSSRCVDYEESIMEALGVRMEHPDRVCIVFYEELLVNPLAVVKRLALFLHHPGTTSALHNQIAKSIAQDEMFPKGFYFYGGGNGQQRRGSSGQGRVVFSPAAVARNGERWREARTRRNSCAFASYVELVVGSSEVIQQATTEGEAESIAKLLLLSHHPERSTTAGKKKSGLTPRVSGLMAPRMSSLLSVTKALPVHGVGVDEDDSDVE